VKAPVIGSMSCSLISFPFLAVPGGVRAGGLEAGGALRVT
jgi:hypothetical protein